MISNSAKTLSKKLNKLSDTNSTSTSKFTQKISAISSEISTPLPKSDANSLPVSSSMDTMNSVAIFSKKSKNSP